MTPLEASQRAVMFMVEILNGGPLPGQKKPRNRGAARRAKIKARRDRLHSEARARHPARCALALAHQLNKMVEAGRREHA
jgi:hypothetical protein